MGDDKSFSKKFIEFFYITLVTAFRVIRVSFKYIVGIIMLLLLLDFLMYMNYGEKLEDNQGSFIFGKHIKLDNKNILNLPENSNISIDENESIMDVPESVLDQALSDMDNKIHDLGAENYTGGLVE